MAAQDQHSAGGAMDIKEHVRTWNLFLSLIKWSMGGIGLIMIGLAIFRTHN
jgi:hypothetical protein